MATPVRRSLFFTARIAVVLAVMLSVLRCRLLWTRDKRDAFHLVQQCARRVLKFGGCRVQLHGDLNRLIPRDGHAMVVANHVSLADAAVLLGTLPMDIRFVANHLYARYPLLGAAIRAASANIVDRDSWRSRADSGQAMVDALASGQMLLVFPEGGTSADGLLQPFRTGAFRAAARTGRPIVPIVLRGTRELLPADSRLLANHPITIDVLPPLTAHDATRSGVADLRDRTRDSMRQHLERMSAAVTDQRVRSAQ